MKTLQEYTDMLESFIDSHGLDTVIATLGIICDDKAVHIQTSYNDKQLAKVWQKAGDYLAIQASNSVAIKTVSDAQVLK